MPKIWDNLGGYNLPLVVEDPRAGNDGFYIDGVKHDKTSLTPAFGRKMNMNYLNTKVWEWPHDNQDNDFYHNSAGLHLSKMTVTVGKPAPSSPNGSDHTNFIQCHHFSDTSFNNGVGAGGYKAGSATVVTDGTDETVHLSWNKAGNMIERAYPKIPITTDLDQQNPTLTDNNVSESYAMSPLIHWGKVFTEGTRKWKPALRYGSSSSFYPNMNLHVMYDATVGEEWPDIMHSEYQDVILGMGNYWFPQFVGETIDNQGLIFISGYGANARTTTESGWIKVVQEKWNNNSQDPIATELFEYKTTPPAAGSHQGGQFNAGNSFWGTTFSQQFDDPRGTANTKCMYHGWYDSYGNYAPQLITWNTSTDTFALEHDITLDVNSTVHSDMRTSSNTSNTSSYKHAFAVTTTWTSGGNRYLCDFKIDGRCTFFENDEDWKTWVVYKVDASTPKTLTYHSKVVMPGHARQWIWLNDSQTLMGVWFQNSFVVYSWNDTTGWNSTTTLNHSVYEVGRDSLDRIWFTKASSTIEQRKELHLLTPTLPVTISVTPELTSYTYSGSDIVTNLAVSAINASGARIATSVKLTIEGSSMKFSDDSTTKTVTTLTTGDLSVATKVVGAGFTNVAASIEI